MPQELYMNQIRKGLSAHNLKLICITSMFIDHIAAVLIMRWIAEGGNWDTAFMGTGITVYQLYRIFKSIGRLALPMYCFFLVEGFFHTRNRRKYASRLLVFALISEIPFDWAFNTYPKITPSGIINLMPELGHQNIFFTLFIGFMMMWGMDEIRKRIDTLNISTNFIKLLFKGIAFLFILIAASVTATVLKTDYVSICIIAIAAIYVVYLPNGSDSKPVKLRQMIGFALGTLVLCMASSLGHFGFFALIPMYLYNGQRGRQNKYFFYAFYPVHLLLLAIVGMLLSYYVWRF